MCIALSSTGADFQKRTERSRRTPNDPEAPEETKSIAFLASIRLTLASSLIFSILSDLLSNLLSRSWYAQDYLSIWQLKIKFI